MAIANCIKRPVQRVVSWTDRLDKVLTHKVWGTLIFIAIMGLMFQSIFTFANWPMELIKSGIRQR